MVICLLKCLQVIHIYVVINSLYTHLFFLDLQSGSHPCMVSIIWHVLGDSLLIP